MDSELTPGDALGRGVIQAKGKLTQKCWNRPPLWLDIWTLASVPWNLRPDGWVRGRSGGLWALDQSLGVQGCFASWIIIIS